MCRRSDTLRGTRRYEPISDEKGYPRGKTQSEIGEAIEESAFVPWGACSTLSTRSNSSFYAAVSLCLSLYLIAKSFTIENTNKIMLIH